MAGDGSSAGVGEQRDRPLRVSRQDACVTLGRDEQTFKGAGEGGGGSGKGMTGKGSGPSKRTEFWIERSQAGCPCHFRGQMDRPELR
jgi:hypothetical protein